MEKKRTIEKFGKHYFLGKDEDGHNIWLQDFKWDCGWYWGGGYLHTYTNNKSPLLSRDISSHTHFDSEYLEGNHDKLLHMESPLSQAEKWELLDLMKQFYALREAAEFYRYGGHMSDKKVGVVKSTRIPMESIINKDIELFIIPAVRKLLGGNND